MILTENVKTQWLLMKNRTRWYRGVLYTVQTANRIQVVLPFARKKFLKSRSHAIALNAEKSHSPYCENMGVALYEQIFKLTSLMQVYVACAL